MGFGKKSKIPKGLKPSANSLAISKWTPLWFLLPSLVVISSVIVYPLYYELKISFQNVTLMNLLSQDYPWVGLENYINMFKMSEFSWQEFYHHPFWRSFGNTMVWTIVNVFFHVTLGIFMGVILNRKLPLKPFFRILLILPWAVPQYIVALTWKGMFNYEYGAINIVLTKFFGQGAAISWLSDPSYTFLAAIITNVWLGIPFMMMTTLGGLQSIPSDLYEAADVDGVSGWRKFVHITLPLLKPIMLPATVLGIIWTFNQINIIYIMTSGSGSEESQILVSLVYKKAFEYYRYGYAAAMSIVIFFILFTFSTVLTRSQKKMID